ncbi:unnamed protein product [Paramecium sonneborni]|uniref:Uncharacterized protein n=1 Tax=Paramecium sonneborni TaxID=65129 RepID=A0A8S1M613_9CILI|nr:unnamed protein product [Paramecium sonneborni]
MQKLCDSRISEVDADFIFFVRQLLQTKLNSKQGLFYFLLQPKQQNNRNKMLYYYHLNGKRNIYFSFLYTLNICLDNLSNTLFNF